MSNTDLDNLLQVDKALRVNYGEGNSNNETRHIRAIVDDDQIVYRVWSRSKRRWIYHIENRYAFYLLRNYLEVK